MYVWKATTVALACTSLWLGWPEATEPRRAPIRQALQPWVAEAEPDVPEMEISEDIDVIASMRRGDIELAERSILDARPRVSRAAIETLFRAGASEVLVSALTEDAPSWRTERITRALGWIGDDLSVRTLCEMLGDDERMQHERVVIVDALGTTASAAALPTLRRFVEDGSDRQSLDRALAAVAYLAMPEADRLLREWAGRPGALGTLALARLDPESHEARGILRAALEGRDEGRASSAAWATFGSTALRDELLECARSRRDEARNACISALAERGEPALASMIANDQNPMYLALDLGDTEAGREVLRELADSERGEARISALVGLAQHDDRARGELIAAATDLAVAHRVDLGGELLTMGIAEGADILVDAVLSGASRETRAEAFRALASDESGIDALRSLARNGEGTLGEQARTALLSRGSIDDSDVDLLERALEDGNTDVLARLSGELPPRAERVLMDYVDDPEARRGVISLLARQLPVAQALRLAGDDVSLQTMVLQSSSSDEDPAFDAALRRIGETQGLRYLAQRLGNHDAARERLVAALDDGNEEERLVALRHVGNDVEPERLQPFLRDRDPEVRATALEHLQNQGGEAATRAGLGGVRDADPDIRAMSIRGLRSSPDPRARQALIDAMHDPDEDVAIEAASAVIETVGGEAVYDAVELAFDPRVSEDLRRRLAGMVMNAGYELDEDTAARIYETAGRVIQLDEF